MLFPQTSQKQLTLFWKIDRVKPKDETFFYKVCMLCHTLVILRRRSKFWGCVQCSSIHTWKSCSRQLINLLCFQYFSSRDNSLAVVGVSKANFVTHFMKRFSLIEPVKLFTEIDSYNIINDTGGIFSVYLYKGTKHKVSIN